MVCSEKKFHNFSNVGESLLGEAKSSLSRCKDSYPMTVELFTSAALSISLSMSSSNLGFRCNNRAFLFITSAFDSGTCRRACNKHRTYLNQPPQTSTRITLSILPKTTINYNHDHNKKKRQPLNFQHGEEAEEDPNVAGRLLGIACD